MNLYNLILQDFHEVVKSSDIMMGWPERRSAHASAVINTISSNGKVRSHLIVLGGVNCYGFPISDCWIINLQCLIWYQVIYITNCYNYIEKLFYVHFVLMNSFLLPQFNHIVNLFR